MDRIRVFIADASPDFTWLMARELARYPDLEVVGRASTGEEAYRALSEQPADVLLLDVVLRGTDGLELLRRLHAESRMPAAVVLTAFYSSTVAAPLLRLGVTEILSKPCYYVHLIRTIRKAGQAHGAPARPGLDEAIERALSAFGIPRHLDGYLYLRSAVRRAMEDPSAVRGITKILYPDVAREFNTSASCVERAIRGAIRKGWDEGCEARRRERFGTLFDGPGKAPTNARFIAAIADDLLNCRDLR